MVTLFSENFKIYYYAPWCSLASLITVVLLIFAILLPFFAQFSTSKFWENLDENYEKPIIEAETNSFINYINNDNVSIYNINNDSVQINPGVNDITINIVGLNDLKKGTELNLIAYFKVYFKSLKLKENVPILIQIQNCSLDKYTKEVTLTINQKKFLKPDALYKENIDDYLEDLLIKQDVDEESFDKLLNYVKYDKDITFQTVKLTENDRELNSDLNFEVDITLTNEFNKFIYNLPMLYNLKFKWIEYLAIFIPTFALIYYVLSFIFKNRIVDCTVVSMIPKKLI